MPVIKFDIETRRDDLNIVDAARLLNGLAMLHAGVLLAFEGDDESARHLNRALRHRFRGEDLRQYRELYEIESGRSTVDDMPFAQTFVPIAANELRELGILLPRLLSLRSGSVRGRIGVRGSQVASALGEVLAGMSADVRKRSGRRKWASQVLEDLPADAHTVARVLVLVGVMEVSIALNEVRPEAVTVSAVDDTGHQIAKEDIEIDQSRTAELPRARGRARGHG